VYKTVQFVFVCFLRVCINEVPAYLWRCSQHALLVLAELMGVGGHSSLSVTAQWRFWLDGQDLVRTKAQHNEFTIGKLDNVCVCVCV